ncbi:MAG: MFS transporter [Candidatus Eisenbacteria bacterium]|nr:MFS transporter [Candidatus Eisenbacteria bacterium]
MRRALRGNILPLGLVSLLTDFSSEMIYPLLPAFFSGLVPAAAAAVYIGLMDGVAESVSGLLKIWSGGWSDRSGRRKALALAGYSLSGLARPLIALAAAGWHVVALRFLDRVGKGIRTAPRDALIGEAADPDVRGLAFAFHRMMDHAGAVSGPLVAALLLYLFLGRGFLWVRGSGPAGPEEMHALRRLFALALLPGIAASVIFWRKVREIPRPASMPPAGAGGNRTSGPPRSFYFFLSSVTVFTLGNSTDLFLVFFAQTRFGLGLGWMIALWILLHLSKIIFSLPGGRLSDRIGRRPAILIGWMVYAAVYATIPSAGGLTAVCVLLVLYGAYYGLTEGAERALIADRVPVASRGRAYGLYHGAVGFAALPASLLFGLFWARLGPAIAFRIGASLAAAACMLLLAARPGRNEAERAPDGRGR